MQYIPSKFWDLKKNISPEWEIQSYVEGYGFPIFTAKRKNDSKKYYCNLIHKDNKESCLKIFEECKKYSSFVEIYDIISTDNITYTFFEAGNKLDEIDENKLLEMFIELNEINTSKKGLIIYYFINKIIFKNNKYKIYPYPSIVDEQTRCRSDIELIGSMVLIFRGFGLKLTNKLIDIQSSIIKMQIEKKPRKDYLNTRLRELLH